MKKNIFYFLILFLYACSQGNSTSGFDQVATPQQDSCNEFLEKVNFSGSYSQLDLIFKIEELKANSFTSQKIENIENCLENRYEINCSDQKCLLKEK